MDCHYDDEGYALNERDEVLPDDHETPHWLQVGLALLYVLLLPLLGVACSLCSGCKAFYENAGSRTRIGSLVSPVEVSDGSDAITVRALYSMDGADVYTAKDSRVKIKYCNAYTNNYFAIVKTQGVQDLDVEIVPLGTNATDKVEGK